MTGRPSYFSALRWYFINSPRTQRSSQTGVLGVGFRAIANDLAPLLTLQSHITSRSVLSKNCPLVLMLAHVSSRLPSGAQARLETFFNAGKSLAMGKRFSIARLERNHTLQALKTLTAA